MFPAPHARASGWLHTRRREVGRGRPGVPRGPRCPRRNPGRRRGRMV